jgi:hypothetical protein
MSVFVEVWEAFDNDNNSLFAKEKEDAYRFAEELFGSVSGVYPMKALLTKEELNIIMRGDYVY